MLILEERDLEAKELRFTSIDGSDGTIVWSTDRFRSRWWLSIETLHGNILFLHEYATPDMPDHKKVIALNLLDGTTLWSNEEMKFLFAHAQSVYVSRDTYEGRTFHELDIAKGEILREVDDATIGALRPAGESSSGIEFPLALTGEGGRDELAAESADVLSVIGSRPVAGGVEYIDAGGRWLIGWHERITPDDPSSPLRHRFTIVDKAGHSVLYQDDIDARVSVPVPDLFIRRNEMAYYIRDKSSLCAVRLGEAKPSRAIPGDR